MALILLVILALVFVAGNVLWYLISHKTDREQDWQEMEQKGVWIDCQPPMSEYEQERCLEAQQNDYPYISY